MNNYSKHNHCKCGKLISNNAKDCISCWQIGENHWNYKDGRSLKKNYCLDCKIEIRWGYKRCHSCACKYIWKTSKNMAKRDLSGANNPMFGVHRFGKVSPRYINGSSFEPYTSEFNSSLKEQIRKRDNFVCQNCGMTEEEHLIVIGQTLHVHHIDYNKENCKEDNLITTCLWCNIRANSNRDYWYAYYTYIMKEIKNAISF